MKKLLFGIAFFSGIAAAAFAMPAAWSTVESRHFIVSFRSAAGQFAAAAAGEAEGYYAKVSRDLGLGAQGYWQQEERVRIYLFDTQDQFRAGTGQPAWADASSIQRLRVIYSFVGAKRFLTQALPHEIAHVMLKETVGFDNRAIPVWFEEGFSSLYEEKDTAAAEAAVRRSLADGSFLGLKQLSSLDIRSSNDSALLDRFYAQSTSIVRYLKDHAGHRKFLSLVRHMRTAEDFEAALRQAYGIKDIQELEDRWKDHLNR